MKIILDDLRPFPENGTCNCVRTYEECTQLIRLGLPIRFISLDYDLGGAKTGLDVLAYMAERGNRVEHINIHSDHSVGVPLMREFAAQHFPNTQLTFNRL